MSDFYDAYHELSGRVKCRQRPGFLPVGGRADSAGRRAPGAARSHRAALEWAAPPAGHLLPARQHAQPPEVARSHRPDLKTRTQAALHDLALGASVEVPAGQLPPPEGPRRPPSARCRRLGAVPAEGPVAGDRAAGPLTFSPESG